MAFPKLCEKPEKNPLNECEIDAQAFNRPKQKNLGNHNVYVASKCNSPRMPYKKTMRSRARREE